jgi:hypothetical protein
MLMDLAPDGGPVTWDAWASGFSNFYWVPRRGAREKPLLNQGTCSASARYFGQ